MINRAKTKEHTMIDARLKVFEICYSLFVIIFISPFTTPSTF